MYTTISSKRQTIKDLLGVEKEQLLYDYLLLQVKAGAISIYDKMFETEYLERAFQSLYTEAKPAEHQILQDLDSENTKLDAEVPLVLDSGDVKCAKCLKNGQNATNMLSSQRQIRSADEGMSIIWRCLTCNHQFAIN